MNYGPKKKPSLPPKLIRYSNLMKKKTPWRQWHSLAKRSSFPRVKGTELSSNSVKPQGHSSRATAIATINNGDLTIQATTPTGTTKRAVSVEGWDTVKRNADSE